MPSPSFAGKRERTSLPIERSAVRAATTATHAAIPIAVLGSAASAILRARRRGRVLASFRRSFYIRFGNDVVCVGPLALQRGPLNALYATTDETLSPERDVEVPAQVARSRAELTVGHRWRFDFGGAEVWAAPVAPAWAASSLRAGLQLLAASARRRSPAGLGALLWRPQHAHDVGASALSDPLLRALTPCAIAIRRWLASALAGSAAPFPPVDALIGLGGGLTPSGDDFLCGIMVALHYFGRKDLAGQVADAVLPRAARDTSLISAAYLRCAANGEASIVLFDALACLLDADAVRLGQCLDAVGRVGHTSGWDCLAGAVTVCIEMAEHVMARNFEIY